MNRLQILQQDLDNLRLTWFTENSLQTKQFCFWRCHLFWGKVRPGQFSADWPGNTLWNHGNPEGNNCNPEGDIETIFTDRLLIDIFSWSPLYIFASNAATIAYRIRIFSSPALCSGWAIVITFLSVVSPSVHPPGNTFRQQLLQTHWSYLSLTWLECCLGKGNSK